MFVVGATDVYSQRAYFSRGTAGDGILSISAPGQDVTAAVAYTAGYLFKEGTSLGKLLLYLETVIWLHSYAHKFIQRLQK